MYAPFFIFLLYMPVVRIATIEMMIALGVIALAFIPKISNRLYTPALVKRKAKAALFTSFGLVLLPLLIITVSDWEAMDLSALLLASHILLIFLFGNFVFGMPVSLISEWATKRAGKIRVLAAFFLHVGFAFVSVFFLKDYMAFAVVSAIVFFVVDEILRKREKFEQQTEMSAVQI